MPTLQFPTPEDRQHVHNLIGHYAHGKCSRNDLMRWVAKIIEKYNLTHMPIFGYSVRVLTYYKDLPIISIESANVSDTCRGCDSGTAHARYLRTEKEDLHGSHDIVSVTCLECGCVYMVSAPNGRVSNVT